MNFQLKKIIESKYNVHYLFWAVLIIQFSIDNWYLTHKSFIIYCVHLLLKNILLLSIVYINILFLIPLFLKKEKYAAYFFSIFIIGVLYTICTVIGLEYYLKNDIKNWKLECSIHGRATVDFLVAMRFFVISFLFYLIEQRYEQQQQITNILLEKTKSDLNYLRSQINPHFLFNTFNNLYGLALEKSNKTAEIILKLSQMMDYMLYESNEQEVLLEKDIENIKNYIAIELLRQKKPNMIKFKIHGTTTNHQKIVPLLFLPLLENGFKHGVNKSIEKGFLESDLIINEKSIIFTMKNNFCDTHFSSNYFNRGIGLTNLKKRLELMYPNKYRFETEIKNGFFYTLLQLNF